jgi:drug/metabolite transporter (DMT)-like permease
MLIYVKLVATMFFWGGTFVAGRVLMRDMGPFSAAFLRFFLASGMLAFLSMRVEGRFPRLPLKRIPAVLLLGMSGIFAYNACFFTGLQTVAASRGALIVAVNPVVVALLASVLMGEPGGRRKVLGAVLSVAGAWVVISKGQAQAVAGLGLGPGEVAFLGAVASWVVYSLVGKVVMHELTPFAAVTWSCILGDALLLGPALAGGLLGDVAGSNLWHWLGLAYLAFLGTGLGFSWYYQGIKAIGPSRASVFINFVPVSAIILGWLLLDEDLGLWLVFGGALVLAGVFLANRPARRAQPGNDGESVLLDKARTTK